jgi:hypothetical protein
MTTSFAPRSCRACVTWAMTLTYVGTELVPYSISYRPLSMRVLTAAQYAAPIDRASSLKS